MQTRAKCWVAAAIGLALLVAFVLRSTRGDRQTARIASTPAEGALEEEHSAVIPVPNPVAERSALAGDAPGAPAQEEPPAVASAPSVAEPLHIEGQLIEGATRAPVPDAEIVLSGRSTARTRCDGEGRFQLELPAEQWSYGESVQVSATLGERVFVFAGGAVLEREMRLVGRTHLVLNGMLVVHADFERGLEGGLQSVGLRANLPRNPAVPVAVFAGSTKLDEHGRFRMDAWVDQVPGSFLLTFGSRKGDLFSTEVPTEELVSEEGATIELPGRHLELTVLDPARAPISGVELRLRSFAPGNTEILYRESDAEGRASLEVLAGPLEVCAGKEGFSCSVAELDIPPGAGLVSHELWLHALGPGDLVAGRVLDERGEPVAGAYVSAFPRTLDHETSAAGHAGVKSDEQGRFRLAVGCDGPLELLATRRGLGLSPSVAAEVGDLDVLIVFASQGKIQVALLGLPTGSEAPSGGLEWLLVGEGDEEALSSHEWELDPRLEEIPAGEHELFVRLSGTELLGRTKLAVSAGQTTQADVQLEPQQRVRGRVTWPDGTPAKGFELSLEGTSLPPQAASLWSAGKTDSNGAFDLLLGASSSSQLVVRADEQELARFPVRAGDTGVLVVPR